MWGAFAEPFQNIHKIFPTKQKYVAEMIAVCKTDPNIKKIIIFGSSVTAVKEKALCKNCVSV